jgi:hypothetical protein
MPPPNKNDPLLQDAILGLCRGDFSRLEPLLDGGEQSRIIDALILAGANLDAVEYPSGTVDVDEVLRRHGMGA